MSLPVSKALGTPGGRTIYWHLSHQITLPPIPPPPPSRLVPTLYSLQISALGSREKIHHALAIRMNDHHGHPPPLGKS